jgi:hypothetical protein
MAQLTNTQIHRVSRALRLAAVEYAKYAELAGQCDNPRLAEQFQTQKAEAIALAEIFEDAESVEVA